jgi:transposase-like protein
LRKGWRFKRIGYHWSHCQKKRIPRFLCLCCRRSFSTQTFATSYWLKRPDILGQLVMKTVGCMANRQIARELRVAPSTIDRQLARLGRHCLLYHTQQMQAAEPASTVAIDGFVTSSIRSSGRSTTTRPSSRNPTSSSTSPTARCAAQAP